MTLLLSGKLHKVKGWSKKHRSVQISFSNDFYPDGSGLFWDASGYQYNWIVWSEGKNDVNAG